VFKGAISPICSREVRRENNKSRASLLGSGSVRYVSGCSRGLYSGYRPADISTCFRDVTPEEYRLRLA